MRLQRRVTAAEKAYKAAKVEIDRLQLALQAEETTEATEEWALFPTTALSGQVAPASRPVDSSPTPLSSRK